MNAGDRHYRKLQKHLDGQAVGFPKASNGSDIAILKHIFTPEEAELATFLSWQYQPLSRILNKAQTAFPVEKIPDMLQKMLERGGIEAIEKNGERFYCNSPLIVGMYEMQLNRLNKEFVRDFHRYTKTAAFGLSFLATDVSQMRTIPIEKSIEVGNLNNVAKFDQVNRLLDDAEGPFAIVNCICREKSALRGKSCKVTDRRETCLAMGNIAQTALLGKKGREISREDARDILRKNQKEGLILQPSNARKPDFICSCCGCCCGMLNIHKNIPKPLDYWSTNFIAAVDEAKCDECGACVKRCQVDAIHLSDPSGKAAVNADLCLGCGHCVAVCTKNALTLESRKKQFTPPLDRDALYSRIAANKKGALGKSLMAGKFLINTLNNKLIKGQKT